MALVIDDISFDERTGKVRLIRGRWVRDG